MSNNLFCVNQALYSAPFVSLVMAGGSGIRFWPLSRKSSPKQFLPSPVENACEIVNSLIGVTIDRMKGLCIPGNSSAVKGSVVVVTYQDHIALVKENFGDISILGEPVGKNTAPCVAYAARCILETVGDIPIVTVPADHIVTNKAYLLSMFSDAIALASKENVLVTFGIKPKFPEVGYGYVAAGERFGDYEYVRTVKQFVEKPDLATAKSYLQEGSYYWNSGMFVWRPSVLLEQIDKHLPNLGEKMRLLTSLHEGGRGFNDFDQVVESIFSSISPVSIDIGVMEKADNVIMFVERETDLIGWSDIGSWESWADSAKSVSLSNTPSDNLLKCDSIMLDSSGCVVIGKNRLIAGVGLEDLVIVDTEDALLIIPKKRAQEVRGIVEELVKRCRTDLL